MKSSIPRGSGRPREKLVHKLDPNNPRFDIIEKAADFILEGNILAIPTDTVYGLACDSTNPAAVKKLYELKGRSYDKPLPVLIDGLRTLNRLVKKIPPDVKTMLDNLWPGALTVIFPKPATMLSSVSSGPSLGVRIPDNTIMLSVISMTARPLAVTSANPSGEAPATGSEKVRHYFGTKIKMILDGGESSSEGVSTVISTLSRPYAILRQGLISAEELKKYLKDIEIR